MGTNGPSDGKEEAPYTPPPHQLATWTVLGIAVVLVLGLFSVRLSHHPNSTREYEKRSLPPAPEPVMVLSEMGDDYFPCSDCHEDEPTNRTVRELEDEHDAMDFKHGDLWCLHCHDIENRNRLQLADHTTIQFEDSWRLCTQCHPKKRADWEAGVHGKQTGSWHGPREYWTCVKCHSPHSPTFESIEPKPAPRGPKYIDSESAAHAPKEDSHHE